MSIGQQARIHHESQPKQQDALKYLRQGVSLTKYAWEQQFKGSRLAPVIDKLRNAHGFDILGYGTMKEGYRLRNPRQMPSRIEVTDSIKEAYYDSAHWAERRESRMSSDEHGCVLCGATDDLCVHHVRYRLFEERLSELMTVCETCHAVIHEDSGLKFPSGMSIVGVQRLGMSTEIPGWLKPAQNGMLFDRSELYSS